ncbi:MAG: hypothetical protein AAF517_14190, partial [Planctomycetota bacterium]
VQNDGYGWACDGVAKYLTTKEPNSGAVEERSILVLDAQPFENVGRLECERALEGTQEACQMAVGWTNDGLPPDSYLFQLDGFNLATITVGFPGIVVDNVPDGRHCVRVLGVYSTDDGNYLGCPVESCCDIACGETACTAPAAPFVVQQLYETDGGNNIIRFSWVPGDTDYENQIVTIDQVDRFQVPPEFAGMLLPANVATSFQFGVRGVCPTSESTITSADRFRVELASPHSTPVEGAPECILDPDTSVASVKFEIGDPSEFYFVYIDEDPRELNQLNPNLILGGRVTEFDVTGASTETVIHLQFFTYFGPSCYGSGIVSFSPEIPPPPPEDLLVRGVCSGVGANPRINDAIFGLNFLFLGGTQPNCNEACDVNRDGNLNLTDMVHLLRFLFLGGLSPVGWIDSDGDGTNDSTCVEVLPEMDCVVSNSGCDV